MTTEKALELLNDMEFSEKYQGVQEYTEMLMVCKEALERQIPFKPETDKLIVGVGRCKCKAELLDKETKYCGNCGQALEWRKIF